MALNKQNISISFGQGLDLKTDPNQVVPGKLLALNNAVLSETMALKKRNGYQSIASFNNSVSSSSLTNQKLGILNNQLIEFDSKAVFSLGNNQNILIDNFLAAQPSVANIAREATPIINQDISYNTNANTTLYTWSSSCIAPNFQQLAFAGATGKFQITSSNGTVLASTGIANFVKTKAFSIANSFIWVGVNYATSALAYYQIPANGSSANFVQTAIGNVGGDFSANTSQTGFNRYQRYDGAVVSNGSLYLGWFNPATSSINITLFTNAGVTSTRSDVISSIRQLVAPRAMTSATRDS